jgi:TatD DNase family protein
VPIERLLIETDCRTCLRFRFADNGCTSALIPYTAAKIAEIKGVDTQHLLNVTADNTAELFGIKY